MSSAPHDRPVPARVFVTGANGFIGRRIMAAAAEAGAEAAGMDLAADPERGVVAGDTTRLGPWRDALAGADVVIHTAAIVSNVAPLDAAWRVNVAGTRHVLEAARDAGVGRVVHLSSIVTYGFAIDTEADERTPARVNGTPYVDTKVNGEAVVLAAHAAGEVEVTVVRPGDVYGPGSRPWVLIPLDLLRKKQLILPDGGRGIFSPVYVDDLVDGILRAASVPAAAGQIYNLSGGADVPCADYFGRLAALVGVGRVPTLPGGPAVGLAEVIGRLSRAVGVDTEVSATSVRMLRRRAGYSIAKAREQLGYAPAVDLDEGMRRTGAWLRAEGLVG